MVARLEHPVVVGVAGVGVDDVALEWAGRTARRTGAELVVVHASEPEALAARMAGGEAVAVTSVLEAEEELVAELEQHAAALGERLGVTVRTDVSRGSPTAALLAHQDDAALLVVGTGARGALEEFVLGSTSLGVAAHARRPVAVVNAGVQVDSLDHGVVGLGLDGSDDSARAARAALALGELTGASVTALTTWFLEVVDGYVVTEPDSPEWAAVERRHAEALVRVLQPAVEAYPDVPVEWEVRRGAVVPTLLEAARGWDALVVGSRGRGSIRGWLLGSVSQRLMRSAPCPVIVSRAP
ncbi:Universal stress protein family [Serinicoccus hydrothermalis]|uniref:Universal stress protein family n=1 Tax=Serinicoccus hydrothermalis TaxID=1758689 RepID=A0A1B1NG06_9MICO|nr:universal stress protein [Serinicoccus hydrothermalis]ANS80375.1 Universal stress protein family [Serinicoccus hydrothermalis]